MIGFLLFTYAQVLIVVWLALFWAKRSRVAGLAHWLRFSAKGAAVLLALAFAIAGLSSITCQMNGLNGLSNCTLFPLDFANESFAAVFVLVYYGFFFAAATFIVGAVIEYRARR